MLNVPLVLLFALVVFCAVKWGPAKGSHVTLGVVFGLFLASTALGPMITRLITALSTALVNGAARLLS